MSLGVQRLCTCSLYLVLRPTGCRASPSTRVPSQPGWPTRGHPEKPGIRRRAGPARLLLAAGGTAPPCRPNPSLGKPGSRAELESPRRVEPVAGSRGQSRGGGGGAPEGEKESAAESKRLVGEGCQHLALLGSSWTRALKEAVAGHPAPIWLLSPSKVSLALQGSLG